MKEIVLRIRAKFRSTCPGCSKPIRAGETVEWTKGARARHPDCKPQPELRIEYPAHGATYHHNAYGVYEYGEYESWSVLAGETRRSFKGLFETLESAQAAFPTALYDPLLGSLYQETYLPLSPPSWFDPAAAGESWSEDE